MSYRYPVQLLLCLMVVAASGCQSLSFGKWGKEEEIVYETPSKIVAIWTNSVFNEVGKPPVRGLGGRVYFYDAEHHPIQVDGKLSVFLYDDTDRKGRRKQEATKAMHFTPEQVASKFTPTDFGASYSFWVPWDEVGGERAQLSVIPVFTSNSGEMLVGEQARHLLPGSNPIELAEDEAEDDKGVQKAGYLTTNPSKSDVIQAAGIQDQKLSFESTSIKLPPAMQRRLRNAPRRDRSRSSTTNMFRKERKPVISDRRQLDSNSEHKDKYDAARTSAIDSEANASTTATLPPADYQLDPRQVQTLQSAQQAISPARNPLARGVSPFSR